MLFWVIQYSTVASIAFFLDERRVERLNLPPRHFPKAYFDWTHRGAGIDATCFLSWLGFLIAGGNERRETGEMNNKEHL